MHLSLLSDAYLSDSLDDAGAALVPASRLGRETLLRGATVIVVFSVLMGLTCLFGTIPSAEAAKTHPPRTETAIDSPHRIVLP